MAPIQLARGYKTLVCLALVLPSLHTATGMSGWGGCLEGRDVFATVRENSLSGEVVAELTTETAMEGVRWSLNGKDADWFFLDERRIRLNASADKVLDREALGPVLMAELLCYEEETLQGVYRIIVEILNENDNSPVFAEGSVLSFVISELTPVNTVVFTVRATDADNDRIIYSIDQTSPDAEYFKVDLPNSGEVILSKPLDYETKTALSVTIHASEMSTAEHFNTSTDITIAVLDGDDQYPQFLPCVLLFQDEASRICTSPVYSVNVTEGEEDIVLDFSPGPIHAVDGDGGLGSPVSYAILSGDDDGRFLMGRETGEVRLIHGVRDRLKTPSLSLQVMAYQDDDPRKYAVATVVVRVLAVNQFYPEFETAEYKGFVTAGRSPASLVKTYGSKALMLHVQDQDFYHGFNPMIHFAFSPTSNHTDIYQITQEGLLITRTSQLKPKQKHVLEVMAVDRESGDATFATVVVEVLSEGQSIPPSPMGDRLTGCAVGKALFLSVAFMSALGCVLSTAVWLKRKHKGLSGPLERGCVAQSKHPNVSLRWFQPLSFRNAMPGDEEAPYSNEKYGTYNPSFGFHDTPGNYTHRDLPSHRGPLAPRATAAPDTSFIPAEGAHRPLILINDVSTPIKSSSSSPTSHPASADLTPKCTAQMYRDPAGAPTDTSPSPATHDTNDTPPFTRSDSQNTPAPTDDDPADPADSPSLQSSIPCRNARTASAELDKPFGKPCVKTPPDSPFTSSPLPKQMGAPPPAADHAPLKAELAHMDSSPFGSPLATPERASVPRSTGADEPSTPLDWTDQSEHPREHLTNSGSEQDCGEVLDVDDGGFLGDDDENREGADELEPEDEELLRALARCNPIFLTFSK